MINIESTLSQALRAAISQIPIGAAIPDSKEYRNALAYLERFIDNIISEIHHEWNESLDGILPAIARRTGPTELELSGVCILISDQTTTPLHVRMQIAEQHDEICWMECRLGEMQNGEMKRTPYSATWSWKRPLEAMDDPNKIAWAFAVTFGERQ